MATLTISIASTPITATKSYTISDADVQTLLNWAQAQYFPLGGTPTNSQMLLAWVNDWVNGTVSRVKNYLINQSASAISGISIQ